MALNYSLSLIPSAHRKAIHIIIAFWLHISRNLFPFSFLLSGIFARKIDYFSESLLKNRLKKNLSRFHQKAFPHSWRMSDRF
jgi:hypothetical protein